MVGHHGNDPLFIDQIVRLPISNTLMLEESRTRIQMWMMLQKTLLMACQIMKSAFILYHIFMAA